MRISSHRLHSRDLRFDPCHSVQIQNVDIVEALVTVIAAEHVQFAAHSGHSVARPRRRFLLLTSYQKKTHLSLTCPDTLGLLHTRDEVLRT